MKASALESEKATECKTPNNTSNQTRFSNRAFKNQKDPNEGFCFHILIDSISNDSRARLATLEEILSQRYPCEFRIQLCEDSHFQGLPKLHGNYTTYFRLKLASLLPSNIKRCLYMDIDMLCLGDIREIFSIDMGGKICAAALDADYKASRIMPPLNLAAMPGFALNLDCYFNAGLILIDMEAWRAAEVERLCFEFLQKYRPVWHDQDTLNAVIGDKVKFLPLEWNFMVAHLGRPKRFLWALRGQPDITYSWLEIAKARRQLKILHFVCPTKPWQRGVAPKMLVGQEYDDWLYLSLWWRAALETPVFNGELSAMHHQGLLSLKEKPASRTKRTLKRLRYSLHLL